MKSMRQLVFSVAAKQADVVGCERHRDSDAVLCGNISLRCYRTRPARTRQHGANSQCVDRGHGGNTWTSGLHKVWTLVPGWGYTTASYSVPRTPPLALAYWVRGNHISRWVPIGSCSVPHMAIFPVNMLIYLLDEAATVPLCQAYYSSRKHAIPTIVLSPRCCSGSIHPWNSSW